MGRTLLVVQIALGLLVGAFALTRLFWMSELLLFLGSAALIVTFSLTSSLVQLNVADHLRGRMMGIYMVAFRGGMPLGSLAAGYAATLVPTPWVLATNGGLIVIVAAYFLASRSHGISDL